CIAILLVYVFSMLHLPPRSTLFPYTTLFRSGRNALMPNVLVAFRAIPILQGMIDRGFTTVRDAGGADYSLAQATETGLVTGPRIDRKSTRLNSSHVKISYAVFCLKKKKNSHV